MEERLSSRRENAQPLAITHVKGNLALAHNRTVEEMRRIIGADTLGFLSTDAVRKIARDCCLGFCDACFTARYPMEVPEQTEKNMFESEIEA